MQARGSNIAGTALAALFAVLVMPASVNGQPPDIPARIDGAVTLTAEELVQLAERYPQLVMVDARLSGDRRQGYIEGSMSLPDTQTNCNSLARLLPQLNIPVLFYCNGFNCRRSARAVRQALLCGYTRVYWFRGGFAEWKAKNYPYLSN